MSADPAIIPLTQRVPSPMRRFGKYYLVRKLAKGGMAEIYLAKQTGEEGFERDVVVKCMLDHFNDSREFVSMFLDEARLAARLFHPNIVQITDLGLEENTYYICMEYLPGEDLQSVIECCVQKQQYVPLSVASKVILSACEGLEFAHGYEEGGKKVNLVHRDVSPSNIIVTYQGVVKVVDFGIAKASSKLVKTQPGTLKGKWGYMSPEQARGEDLDGRSDVFSLGITFYELLTGQRVFAVENEVGLMFSMMAKPVLPPSQIRPEIPPALDDIVLKATQRDRDERYPNAAAMRADLLHYLAGSSSIPGVSDLAGFMQTLFGRKQADQKIHIPTLREMLDSGEAVLEAEKPAVDVRAATLVRVRNPGVETSTPPIAVPQGSEPPPARWAAAAVGAVAAVVLLALGATAGWFLLRSPTMATPPTPAAVIPPPNPTASPAPSAPLPAVASAPAPKTPEATPAPVPTEAPAPPRPHPAVMLTTKEIAAVFRAAKDDITGCFERHRTTLTGSDGQINITFTVANPGFVRDAQIATPGLDGSALGGCIVQRVKALHFPRNRNKPELTISVPLKYVPVAVSGPK